MRRKRRVRMIFESVCRLNAVSPGKWAAGEKILKGAPVRLLDRPTFEMRNQIVSDGLMRIAPPVTPFHINITAEGQANPVVLVKTVDHRHE